jgi:hypothetical protein
LDFKQDRPELSQTRVAIQVIKVKHHHNSLTNMIPLVNYVKTTTNKRLLISESHDNSNRCTPCRGNLIYTTRTLLVSVHVYHTYASHEQSPYKATFHADPTLSDRFTALEKKCSKLHLSARLSGPRDPPQFLSQYNH